MKNTFNENKLLEFVFVSYFDEQFLNLTCQIYFNETQTFFLGFPSKGDPPREIGRRRVSTEITICIVIYKYIYVCSLAFLVYRVKCCCC